LLALGEAAVGPLVARLDAMAGGPTAVRERLFELLRQLPGPAAEARIIDEARRGVHDTTRTMAIEALAQRNSERALDALTTLAQHDPLLPADPFLGGARRGDDPSTELPDERVFTPRMQAMAALASTRDPRAVALLADVARRGPDESLRMEAARHLGPLRDDARALAALRSAAGDGSAVVRLAALHALRGAADPGLPALLARMAAGDRDAGVRALARELLDGTRTP
jgi:HEAT repeat protein